VEAAEGREGLSSTCCTSGMGPCVCLGTKAQGVRWNSGLQIWLVEPGLASTVTSCLSPILSLVVLG
jgi:hypothetical protein